MRASGLCVLCSTIDTNTGFPREERDITSTGTWCLRSNQIIRPPSEKNDCIVDKCYRLSIGTSVHNAIK